jgi:branched-chain amino acid transport system substrate-binding protein
MRMKKLLFLLMAIVLITSFGCGGKDKDQTETILNRVQQEVQSALNRLDQDMAGAAKKLSDVSLTDPSVRSVLDDLSAKHPYAVDSCTIDPTGKILVMEPSSYSEYEGSDVSQQDAVIRLYQTQQPVLSQTFRAVERFDAVDIEHPIFSSKNTITGSVSILFKPEALLGNIISPAVQNTPYYIWAMQTNGRVLYDIDTNQVGKNLFVDPMYQPYTQLISLSREIAAKKSGKGYYEFIDYQSQQVVKKKTLWGTVGLHGTEWRLVLIQVVSKT